MLKHSQGMFGSTEEFPPGLYFKAVSFSAVSWVKWERQSTALTDTDKLFLVLLQVQIPLGNRLDE